MTDGHREMAHVLVRRAGTHYTAESVADSGLRVEAESAADALRRMRELLEDQVNNRSTARSESR